MLIYITEIIALSKFILKNTKYFFAFLNIPNLQRFLPKCKHCLKGWVHWQSLYAKTSAILQWDITFHGERDIYQRKPKSCLGRVFNFKLGSLTENTINPLNANGHILSWKLGSGFIIDI